MVQEIPPNAGSSISTPVSIADGGTSSSTADGARLALGAAESGVNEDIERLIALEAFRLIGVMSTGGTLSSDNTHYILSGAGPWTLPTVGTTQGIVIKLWHDSLGTGVINAASGEHIHIGLSTAAESFTLTNGEAVELISYYSVGIGPYWLAHNKFTPTGSTLSLPTQVTGPTGIGADYSYVITSGSGSYNLPAISSNGKVYFVSNDSTATATITASSGNVFFKSATSFSDTTLSLGVGESIALVSYNAGGGYWWVVGHYNATQPVTRGGTGISYPIARTIDPLKKLSFYRNRPGSTTLDFIGSATTPAVNNGTATSVTDSDGSWNNVATNASSNTSGYYTSCPIMTICKPVSYFRVKTGSDITNVTYWFGLTEASFGTSTSTTFINLAAFRYATAVDGTVFWRTITNDGGGDSGTVTTTSIAVQASTVYEFVIDASSGTDVKFYINGVLASTHTTDLPTTTTSMNHYAGVATTEAVSKEFRFSQALSQYV